jgi:Tfp pilus assembly protein PilF
MSSTSSVCCATEKMCAPSVWPFQRATRASPCAMSSISTSSGEGSSRSSRRPDSMRCQARDTAVYINRGLLYERTKQFEKARADFEEAVKRPPKYRNGPAGQQIARQRLRELGVAAPR